MTSENINEHQPDTRGLWPFFILTFAISWGIWIPVILLLSDGESLHPLAYLGGFGPLFAAILLKLRYSGGAGLKSWFREVFSFRIGYWWFLIGGLFLPLAVGVYHFAIYLGLGGEMDFSEALVWYGYPVNLLGTAIIGGGNEEPGFTGYALPKLLAKYSPVVASLIIAFPRVLWHAPLYMSSSWSGAGQLPVWFLAYAGALFIIMTWLYNRSKWSVIPVMLLHAGTNCIFRHFPEASDVLPMLADDFDVIKTVVYWTIAIILIVKTHGSLGYGEKMSNPRSA